jgi:hypothetical protein
LPPRPGGPAHGQQLQPLSLRPKALALLVRLALVPGAEDRDALAKMLFPDAINPRESLRWQLSQLRARVPCRIEADRRTVAVTASTDVARFPVEAERILAGTTTTHRRSSASTAVTSASVCGSRRPPTSTTGVRPGGRASSHPSSGDVGLRPGWNGGGPRRSGDSVAPPADRDRPMPRRWSPAVIQALEMESREDEAPYACDRHQRIVRDEMKAEPRADPARRHEGVPPVGYPLPFDELVPLENITIHIVDWPGGDPPIVAIHGSTGHASSYTAMGEQLKTSVRVDRRRPQRPRLFRQTAERLRHRRARPRRVRADRHPRDMGFLVGFDHSGGRRCANPLRSLCP